MEIIIKDLQKLVPKLPAGYIHTYAKSTGEYKLMDGWLHSIFTTQAIRLGMEEKRHRSLTATRLCTKHRETSLNTIKLVLDAIDILEGNKDEKQTKNR